MTNLVGLGASLEQKNTDKSMVLFYLTNHEQFVRCSKISSSYQSVSSRALQRTMLGSSLLLIYTNDNILTLDSQTVKYADDFTDCVSIT